MNETYTNPTCIQKPLRGGFRAAPLSTSEAAHVAASVFNIALFAAEAPAAHDDDKKLAGPSSDELDLARLVMGIDESRAATAAHAETPRTIMVRFNDAAAKDERTLDAAAASLPNASIPQDADAAEASAYAAASEKKVAHAAQAPSSETQGASTTSSPSAPEVHASHASAPAAPRCTYRDCITGRAGIPERPLGKRVFQILMVGGMVSFMATINGLLHQGAGFFAHALWMYPLVFCIAFLVRTLVAGKLVDAIAPRLVLPRTRGIARSITMTLLNVGIMGTIMGFVVTLLMSGTQDYLATVASTLPVSLVAATLVNYFIVGPAVRMICANVIEPGGNARFVVAAQKYAMPWTAIFSN